MLTTTNFKLKKPESTDYAKISDLNDNADIIDAEIAKRPTRDDMDDVIDTKFTTSTSRAKLDAGRKAQGPSARSSGGWRILRTAHFPRWPTT